MKQIKKIFLVGARGIVIACTAVSMTVSSLPFAAMPAHAATTGSLSFSPSSSSLSVGQTFNVGIVANTGGESITAVTADLTYDASRLQLVSIDGTGSAFGTALIECWTGNTASCSGTAPSAGSVFITRAGAPLGTSVT